MAINAGFFYYLTFLPKINLLILHNELRSLAVVRKQKVNVKIN